LEGGWFLTSTSALAGHEKELQGGYSRLAALFPFASPTPLGTISPNRVKINFPISNFPISAPTGH
jgi:hypothetical protein